MTNLLQEATFSLGGAVLGIVGPIGLAIAGTVDAGQIVVPIASAGPIGAVAGFLLLRLRERDREEREERGKAWMAVGLLRDEVQDTKTTIKDALAENRNELTRIATILERQPPK